MNDGVLKMLQASEVRIDWVLNNAAMSSWLKEALRGALKQDPVVASTDAEVLSNLLRARASSWMQSQLGTIGEKICELG